VDATELKAIAYERDEGVALVTLSRPDRLNAWTNRMAEEFRWAMEAAEADDAVRVVVVTGAGRGFCAGADFEALDNLVGGAEYGPTPSSSREDVFLLAPLASKPVIACVNGPAAGVGFVLMAFCDIRFAAAGAKLTTAFARLGLPAEHGVQWALARLVGYGHAADLLFSARVVLAEEAAAMGLVNRVLPAADVLAETMAYAKRMAAEVSPTSLYVLKRQLWSGLSASMDDAAAVANEVLPRMLAAPDFKEGTSAFQAKRPPAFGPADRGLWPG